MSEILLQFAIPPPKGKELSQKTLKELKARLDEAERRGNLSIELEGLELERVPKYVNQNMLHYQQLKLGFNHFSDWPDLYSFTQLTVLDLSGNQLTSISPNIGMLASLKELFVNGNQISSLPAEIGDLAKLERLDVSNNRMSTLVDDIGLLTRLEVLQASGNPISRLPEAIGNCIGIETCDLSCCELSRLPDQFCFMTRLLELNLGSNRLEELPESIGRMTRLVILNLSDNKLIDLPLSLGYCIGLSKIGAGINLDRNPIKSSDMLKKWKIGTDHLCDFLEKRMTVEGPPTFKDYPKWKPVENRLTYVQRTQKISAPQIAVQSPPDQRQTQSNNNNNSPSPSVAPASPVFARAQPPQNPSLEDKIRALSQWGENVLTNDVMPKIVKAKNDAKSASSLNDALKIAQLAATLKPEVEKLQKLVEASGLPVGSSSKIGGQPTDKLDAVKMALENAFLEIQDTLEASKAAIKVAQQKQVLEFVSVLKILLQKFSVQ